MSMFSEGRPTEATLRLNHVTEALRTMAARFDGGNLSGLCAWCYSPRQTSVWDFGRTNCVGAPAPCTNAECGSHAVRSILAPEA